MSNGDRKNGVPATVASIPLVDPHAPKPDPSVGDLVKDATILPQAFVSAVRGDEEQEFRQACIENLTRGESLDFMIDTLKAVAEQVGA